MCWPKEVTVTSAMFKGQRRDCLSVSTEKSGACVAGLCGQSCKKIVQCENSSGFNTIQFSQQIKGGKPPETFKSKICALCATARNRYSPRWLHIQYHLPLPRNAAKNSFLSKHTLPLPSLTSHVPGSKFAANPTHKFCCHRPTNSS